MSGQGVDDDPPYMNVCTFSRQGGASPKGPKQTITILVCRNYFVIPIVTQKFIQPAELLTIKTTETGWHVGAFRHEFKSVWSLPLYPPRIKNAGLE